MIYQYLFAKNLSASSEDRITIDCSLIDIDELSTMLLKYWNIRPYFSKNITFDMLNDFSFGANFEAQPKFVHLLNFDALETRENAQGFFHSFCEMIMRFGELAVKEGFIFQGEIAR